MRPFLNRFQSFQKYLYGGFLGYFIFIIDLFGVNNVPQTFLSIYEKLLVLGGSEQFMFSNFLRSLLRSTKCSSKPSIVNLGAGGFILFLCLWILFSCIFYSYVLLFQFQQLFIHQSPRNHHLGFLSAILIHNQDKVVGHLNLRLAELCNLLMFWQIL